VTEAPATPATGEVAFYALKVGNVTTLRIKYDDGSVDTLSTSG
jgi:hypothetical protein